MKKISLLCLTMCTFFSISQAQISDRLVPHMGFMYEFITTTLPTSNKRVRDFYNFHIGTYIALLHSNDIVSLGVDPSVNFGFNLFNTGQSVAFDYTVQVPVLLMGRLGASATPYNQQKIGVGVGVGAKYTYFSRHTDPVNKQQAGFLNPVVVGEISFVSRGGPISIRGIFSIADAIGTLTNTNGGDIDNTAFSASGIGLLYGF